MTNIQFQGYFHSTKIIPPAGDNNYVFDKNYKTQSVVYINAPKTSHPGKNKVTLIGNWQKDTEVITEYPNGRPVDYVSYREDIPMASKRWTVPKNVYVQVGAPIQVSIIKK